MMRDAVMRRVYKERGFASIIAKELGITPSAVQQWRRVPPEYVMTLAPLLEMRPEDIRPDIFGTKKQKKPLPDSRAAVLSFKR